MVSYGALYVTEAISAVWCIQVLLKETPTRDQSL